jgi:hypothetical protein
MEGAQLGVDAGELLLESMDRCDQLSRSVAWAEVAQSFIEREDDELQPVVAMPQPHLAQAISERSATARSTRPGCRRTRLSGVSDHHQAVRRSRRGTTRAPSL